MTQLAKLIELLKSEKIAFFSIEVSHLHAPARIEVLVTIYDSSTSPIRTTDLRDEVLWENRESLPGVLEELVEELVKEIEQ